MYNLPHTAEFCEAKDRHRGGPHCYPMPPAQVAGEGCPKGGRSQSPARRLPPRSWARRYPRCRCLHRALRASLSER
eukprot:7008696-Prorocentrum_lima.AAC.1